MPRELLPRLPVASGPRRLRRLRLVEAAGHRARAAPAAGRDRSGVLPLPADVERPKGARVSSLQVADWQPPEGSVTTALLAGETVVLIARANGRGPAQREAGVAAAAELARILAEQGLSAPVPRGVQAELLAVLLQIGAPP